MFIFGWFSCSASILDEKNVNILTASVTFSVLSAFFKVKNIYETSAW